MASHRTRPHAFAASLPQPEAGVVAGLVAGLAYLLAQVSLAAWPHLGPTALPLQRIAAILMGPDEAPPASWSFVAFGMALIIHFGLAMVFGRIVCTLVWRRPAPSAIAIGAGVGLLLYALDFGLLAPHAFPWFGASPAGVTAVDHALFGAVAALVCVVLRPPQA